jgi:hypothetical protein
MAIIKGKYWHSLRAKDLKPFLKAYSVNGYPVHRVQLLRCRKCHGDVFYLDYDADESVARTKCASCSDVRYLLDSEELWKESKPKRLKCKLCGGSSKYNIAVGIVYRKRWRLPKHRHIKWFYIGNRCTSCNVLGSCMDYSIDYGPTYEMERELSLK